MRRSTEQGSSGSVPTVEGRVRSELARHLGGARGSLETAVPLVVFTLAHVLGQDHRAALIAGGFAVLLGYGLRVAQRSTTTFVRQGLLGLVLAAVLVLLTGRAETAFLPGIIQNAVWALVLGASLVVRWPVAGFLVGAVLGDTRGWRHDAAIRTLADRLTLILLAPMVLRLGVQVPLYLAGEVGWLATSRLALGWPLHAATLAAAGLVLLRGHTPIQDADDADDIGP